MSKSVPVGGPYKAAIGLHEPLTSAALHEARRALFNYCIKGASYCERYLELIREVSRLVARTRLEDLLHDTTYDGSDSPLFATLRRLEDEYARVIGGERIVYGDRILVKTKQPLFYRGHLIDKGEAMLVPISDALLLVAMGYVEALDSNLLKLPLPGGREGNTGEREG